jgi:hypothetical protein
MIQWQSKSEAALSRLSVEIGGAKTHDSRRRLAFPASLSHFQVHSALLQLRRSPVMKPAAVVGVRSVFRMLTKIVQVSIIKASESDKLNYRIS